MNGLQKIFKHSRALFLLLAFLLVFAPISVLADTNEKEKVNYVALGDSLAAGMLYDRSSGTGYVDYITEDLNSYGYNVNLENKGVPGYTTLDILGELDDGDNENVMVDLKNAHIITLSVGANDLLNALEISKIKQFDPRYLNEDFVAGLQREIQDIKLSSLQAIEAAQDFTNNAEKSISEDKDSVLEEIEAENIKENIIHLFEKFEYFHTTLQNTKTNLNNLTEAVNNQDVEQGTTLLIEIPSQFKTTNEALNSINEIIQEIEKQIMDLEDADLDNIDEITNSIELMKSQSEDSNSYINKAHSTLDINAFKTYFEKINSMKEAENEASEINAMLDSVPELIDNIGINVGKILGIIRHVNPDADIYVMGYYNALPYLSDDLQEQIIPMLNGLNQAIDSASTPFDTTYIPTSFGDDFTLFLPDEEDIHPNEKGYRVIADAFMAEISKSYPDITEKEKTKERTEPKQHEQPEQQFENDSSDNDSDLNDKDEEDSKDRVDTDEEESEKTEKVLSIAVDGNDGKKLPKTASNNYNMILIGILFLSSGLATYILIQKRQGI